MQVQYVDHMGSDLAVVNAARVSFDKQAFVFTEKDRRLIQYLAKHGHWSPFAHPMISLRCTAPIYVARQLAKHQVGLTWNEVSRRYVSTGPKYDAITEVREAPKDAKQGSGGVIDLSEWWSRTMNHQMDVAIGMYNDAVAYGVAPEQARAVLPQGVSTQWIWTGSLYAFSRIYNQRTHPTAQLEAQQFAGLLGRTVEPFFPVSWRVLTENKQSPQGTPDATPPTS